MAEGGKTGSTPPERSSLVLKTRPGNRASSCAEEPVYMMLTEARYTLYCSWKTERFSSVRWCEREMRHRPRCGRPQRWLSSPRIARGMMQPCACVGALNVTYLLLFTQGLRGRRTDRPGRTRSPPAPTSVPHWRSLHHHLGDGSCGNSGSLSSVQGGVGRVADRGVVFFDQVIDDGSCERTSAERRR